MVTMDNFADLTDELTQEMITILGITYARVHGNTDLLAFVDFNDSLSQELWVEHDDPIHAIQAASFEEYKHPESPLPTVITDKLHQHVCGKKLSSICPICLEFPRKGELIYKLKCKHHMHVDCASGWFDVASKCPVCTKPIT